MQLVCVVSLQLLVSLAPVCAHVQLTPAAAYVLAYEVLFGQVGSSILAVLVLLDVNRYKQLAMQLWQSPLLC